MKYLLLCLFLILSVCLSPITPAKGQQTETLCVPIIYHCIYFTEHDERLKDLTILNIKKYQNQLNAAFKDKIYFDVAPLVLFHKDLYTLPNLWTDISSGRSAIYKSMVIEYALPGYYNVFIMPTFFEGLTGILGLTPIYLGNPKDLEETTPLFDLALVSYDGLLSYGNGTTLIHETGHWLGLEHTFDMSPKQLENMGLDDILDICVNFMNYGCFLSDFTEEQLDFMVNYLRENRAYLLKE